MLQLIKHTIQGVNLTRIAVALSVITDRLRVLVYRASARRAEVGGSVRDGVIPKDVER